MKSFRELFVVFSPYSPRDSLHHRPVDLLCVELISMLNVVELFASFHKLNEIVELLEDVNQVFLDVLSAER